MIKNNPLNERKIRLTEEFDYTDSDGNSQYLPVMSWADAVTVQGQTLVRVAFGDCRPIHRFQEDDLKDVLAANSHLCRSDLM